MATTLDNVYEYGGSLVSLNDTLIVSAFSGPQSGTLDVTDTDGGHDWDASEAATWDGGAASLIGVGTATVGVSLGPLTLLGLPLLPEINVDAGSSVTVDAFSSGGNTFFYYPGGDPAQLFDGLVSDLTTQITDALPLGQTLSTVLALLGVPDLETYVQQNALLTFDINAGAPIPICFTAGTLIDTYHGPQRIEDLRIGDMVMTMDHGFQPIRWIGRRRVAAIGAFAPVCFAAGAIGNERQLLVSPNHRMLVSGYRAELLFGELQVLVPARFLVDGLRVYYRPGGFVEYVHVLFDEHEIVFAEGAASESFHPGQVALDTLEADVRREVLELMPDIAVAARAVARPVLKAYEALVAC